MYKKSDWIQLALLGLAFVLMYAGTQLGLPVLINLGSASIGAFALVGGIQAIVTKRLGFETRQRNFGPVEMYTGLAAQLWGVLFIAFALLVFFLTGVSWFYHGGAEAFWADFLGHTWGWGILLLGIGLTLVVNGVIRLLAGSAGYYKGLTDLVQRISGIIPLLIGLGMTIVGLLLLVVPGLIMGLIKLVMNSIMQRIFH